MRDIDLSAIRARLAGQKGPAFWRSLDEVAETPEFQAMLHREFPEGASEFTDPAGRRDFLRLMGASIALAGAAACTRQPTEHIVPYVKAPEDLIPGKPLFFATAMPFAGDRGARAGREPHGPADQDRAEPGAPVHARRHRPLRAGVDPRALRSGPLADGDGQGRDSPVERAVAGADERRRRARGAPAAPACGSCPARSRRRRSRRRSSALLTAAAAGEVDPVRGDRLRQRARRRQAGIRRVRRAAVYRLDQADVILSLDADLLDAGPGKLRYARDFAARRRVVAGPDRR